MWPRAKNPAIEGLGAPPCFKQERRGFGLTFGPRPLVIAPPTLNRLRVRVRTCIEQEPFMGLEIWPAGAAGGFERQPPPMALLIRIRPPRGG